MKDKAIFSYPEKNHKKKKIIRREIKIVRLDRYSKETKDLLVKLGARFVLQNQIMIVKDGRVYNYDGTWHEVTVLMHHMQRIANPIVTIPDHLALIDFADTKNVTIWDSDHYGSLLSKGKRFDDDRIMNKYL